MSFCSQIMYPLNNQSLPEYASKNKKIERKSCKKTFLHIRIRGSYTLEMAVVLPIAVTFLTAILFFFRVLQVQTQVQEALVYTSRKIAVSAGVSDNSATLLAEAEVLFRKELQQHEEVQKYVQNDLPGVSLLLSELSGPEVILRADYFVKFPIKLLNVKGVKITQRSASRKWTGDQEQWTDNDYVYITENGTVYHCSRDCSYLDLSIKAVDYTDIGRIKNKNEHKYSGCSLCAEKNKSAGQVYITDYGTCYHATLSCSGLKRTVYIVPLSEVGGKGPCSKCGKAKEGGE